MATTKIENLRTFFQEKVKPEMSDYLTDIDHDLNRIHHHYLTDDLPGSFIHIHWGTGTFVLFEYPDLPDNDEPFRYLFGETTRRAWVINQFATLRQQASLPGCKLRIFNPAMGGGWEVIDDLYYERVVAQEYYGKSPDSIGVWSEAGDLIHGTNYAGRRTMLHNDKGATCLLVEGVNFQFGKTVSVFFEDPRWNYRTSVNPALSDEDAVGYFIGATFYFHDHLSPDPHEVPARCIHAIVGSW